MCIVFRACVYVHACVFTRVYVCVIIGVCLISFVRVYIVHETCGLVYMFVCV